METLHMAFFFIQYMQMFRGDETNLQDPVGIELEFFGESSTHWIIDQ